MDAEKKFPMRINRYAAFRGWATRRDADELVARGRILVNGSPATLGMRVLETDRVELLPARGKKEKVHAYVAYHKPAGVISHSPGRGENAIADVANIPGVFPVGRLDKASRGLIILTDDGRVTERLLHPRFAHEKEYEVRIRERFTNTMKNALTRGIVSDRERLTAKRVTVTGERTARIVLTEGKKHQIRRMLDAVRATTEDLKRVRIMGIRLGTLTSGESRVMEGAELKRFLGDLGLDV